MKLKKTDPPLNIKEATAGARRGMEWEGGQLKRQPAPVYDGMLDEVNITPSTSSEIALKEMMDNKASGGLTPSYPLFDVMTLGLKPAVTVGGKVIQAGLRKSGSLVKPSSSLSSAVTKMLARNSGLNKNVGSAIDGFKFTDNMLAKSSNTPLGLPEPITYYRGTTTDKFKDLMSPVSTTGNKTDRAANLRFFSPNKGVAKNYLEDAKDQGVGLSARINIQNPYRQNQTRLLTNEYVDDLIKKGYDAIQTNYDGSKSLRDAFEVIPLDKNIISNIKTHNKFNKGGILKLKKK
tara:strand:+ start:56 stop:928 length:873 start_codon:yes stop_codon:yes gene_type:complete